MTGNSFIEIKKFNLSYGNNILFSDFNFLVSKGNTAGIFGPTGTGKTTLLNKIVDDYIMKYKISYIFQDNKLIENLNVVKNIMLPLEKKLGKKSAYELAVDILSRVNLKEKADKKVNILSGGERQRVNIARAFSYLEMKDEKENILLMDEPFSAQDEENRNMLINLTKKICTENNVTSVIVSHDRRDLEQLCNFIIEL